MTRTNWHALHIGPQAERWLRKYGLDPMIPVERRVSYTTRYQASLRRKDERPLFPGLAFIEFKGGLFRNNRDEIRWDNVLAIPGVVRVFSPYGEPYQFIEADINVIKDYAKRPDLLPYTKGDKVRVFHGPYRKAHEDVNFRVGEVDFRLNEVTLLTVILGKVVELKLRAGDVRRCAW